jgi:ribosomal protein S18 acetylase RimI-like enzyme
MDGEILIRDAAPDELDAIERLVKTAYLEFQPLMPEFAWSKWLASIEAAIHSGAGMLVVAEQGGEIQGAVKFFPDASQAAQGQWPPGAALIRLLAVWPRTRGQGYGTLLTKECLRRARALKIPTVFLYTGTFMLVAQHIYEKLGFRRVPELDRDPGPIAYRLDL